MNRIIALAYITFLDGLRRNAVWGLCVFALLCEVCGIFFIDFFGHDLGRVISDFQSSIMWVAGMIFILFYAVQALARDDTHRNIDSILARPISRTEYVLGSMAGLSLLLLCFEFLLFSLALVEITWIRPNIGEAYFPIFSTSHFMATWLALQLILLTHLGIVMLVSAAVRGAFPVMLITLAYSLICSGLPVVRESLHQNQHADASAHGLDSLLRGMGLFFPDFSKLDWKDSVLSHQSLQAIIGMPAWLPFGLIGIYLSVILFLACIVYQRQDIL